MSFKTIIDSVVHQDLAADKQPLSVEVNLTSDGYKWSLAFVGKQALDVKMSYLVSKWLSTHRSDGAIRRYVLVQGAKGRVGYEAKPGCQYLTIPQLGRIIEDADKVITMVGPTVRDLEQAVQQDVLAAEAVMPGDSQSLTEISASQQREKSLAEARVKLERAQRCKAILSKVDMHGDAQVVLPYWEPPVRGAFILHKCAETLPDEVRSFLLTVIKKKGPVWDQLFWRSPETIPCPSHSSVEKCEETIAVWHGVKPNPMPRHAQVAVKSAMTSSSFGNWDSYHRSLYAWWCCILAWNFFPGRKGPEKVEFPSELGGRAATKSNKQTGKQRQQKNLESQVAAMVKPLADQVLELVEALKRQKEQSALLPTLTLESGEKMKQVAISSDVDRLLEDISNNDSLSGISELVYPDEDGYISSSSVPEAKDIDHAMDITLYNDLSWLVVCTLSELEDALAPTTQDLLGDLVLCIKPGHPAFPDGYEGWEKLWLVSMRRCNLPSKQTSRFVTVKTSHGVEEILDIVGKTVQAQGEVPKQVPKSQASASSDKGKQVVGKPSTPAKSEKVAVPGGSTPSKVVPVEQENPLRVRNPPKSDGLTDDQKVALKKALKIPDDRLTQAELEQMEKKERRAALAARSLPHWAVTAVLNNPANLERIVKGELTKESFGKSAKDRGTSAQTEWTKLKSKYPDVALLTKPQTQRQRELKKSWDAIAKKWGRDSPGLPKPKGLARSPSRGEAPGNSRGRSRQRAEVGVSMDDFTATVKLIGTLARAFSGN
jgi:hypothetical protein